MPNANVSVFINDSYTLKYYNPVNGQSVVSSGVGRSVNRTMTRVSKNTPDYYHLADKHQLPVNTYQFTKYEMKGMYGGVRILSDSNKATNDFFGCLEGVTHSIANETVSNRISDTIKSNMDAEAINKLLLKAKDQKVNLAQFFHERQMTIDMIAETAKRLAGLMTNLKKGNLVGAAEAVGLKVGGRSRRRFNQSFKKSQSQAIANGWLELQYGWKPLLSDIYGAAEAIANARYAPPKVRAATKVSREFNEVITTLSSANAPGSQVMSSTLRWKSKYDVNYVAIFEPENDVLKAGTALGLTNPLLIAWELMPYSFVVDWFFPVGNWISALDATQGLRFVKGSKTTYLKVNLVKQFYGTAKRATDTQSGEVEGKAEWIRVDRAVLTTWPMLRAPSFKNPVSLLHTANALALLTQLFRK